VRKKTDKQEGENDRKFFNTVFFFFCVNFKTCFQLRPTKSVLRRFSTLYLILRPYHLVPPQNAGIIGTGDCLLGVY